MKSSSKKQTTLFHTSYLLTYSLQHFEPQRFKPNYVSIHPTLHHTDQLTFNRLQQEASSSGNSAYYYAHFFYEIWRYVLSTI